MTTPALSTEGLSHDYGRGRVALSDCTLTIPAGRVVALVGPNGAGKTTLLNIAAGLLHPTAGSAYVAGRTPAQQLSKIGYVAQDAPLWPRLRVSEVLQLGRGMNPNFDEALAFSRLTDLGILPRTRIQTLSGGQRAQVALSLVLGKRPDLLLLDEPLANLDPLARREFLTSMLEACAENGISVLFSSHVISELERICDYLVVLLKGRVRVAGDIDELCSSHRVVTGALGWTERTHLPVVSAAPNAGRTVALVRLDANTAIGPGLDSARPTFEELAMGYLSSAARNSSQEAAA